MKRKLLILSVLAICVATLAAGSLAFFNAEDMAHNIITTGGVDIEVVEWANEGKTDRFENPTGIMPGTVVTKIAEVQNIGASRAWIRVKITKAIDLAGDGTADLSLVELNLNTEFWTEKDGYLYYKEAVEPGDATAPIFTTVTFNTAMGNEYQNATAHVEVLAQAVQCSNNGESALEAQGWPES